MHTFANRLKNLHIYSRRTSIIPIILILTITQHPMRPLIRRQRQCRLLRHPRHDRTDIQRLYRAVDVDVVRVQDFREAEGREDGVGEFAGIREGVFVRAGKSVKPYRYQ